MKKILPMAFVIIVHRCIRNVITRPLISQIDQSSGLPIHSHSFASLGSEPRWRWIVPPEGSQYLAAGFEMPFVTISVPQGGMGKPGHSWRAIPLNNRATATFPNEELPRTEDAM
jgi:hypothetical protein